jgi:hypothetical protein
MSSAYMHLQARGGHVRATLKALFCLGPVIGMDLLWCHDLGRYRIIAALPSPRMLLLQ